MSESSTSSTWLTQEAFDRLTAELARRKEADRKEIASRVEAARQEGDLRENAGYHAAREEAGLNEARIAQLTELLEHAQIGEAADDGSVSAGTIVKARVAGKEQAFALGGQEITADVPEGVKVDIPLQSYFRLNAAGAGQFEHTLIIVEKGAYLHFIEGCSAPKYNVTNLHAGCVELFVRENARLRYSTIENWSRNMMNLNTKRVIVEKNGAIEWVSGSFGSHVSMLYPTSILHGENATCEFTGITFASKGQELDTGATVIFDAPNTSANISTRSISKAGGVAVYRSAVKVTPRAVGAKCSVDCESLMLDSESRSDTLPVMDIMCDQVDIGHEAKIGRISDEAIFYLMSRGIDEDEARAMIVRGFVEPIAKELPLEYAVEMNNLVNIELEGTMG